MDQIMLTDPRPDVAYKALPGFFQFEEVYEALLRTSSAELEAFASLLDLHLELRLGMADRAEPQILLEWGSPSNGIRVVGSERWAGATVAICWDPFNLFIIDFAFGRTESSRPKMTAFDNIWRELQRERETGVFAA